MIEFVNIVPDDTDVQELAQRLARRDTSLWHTDPEIRRRIDQRLGWLDAAGFMDRQLPRIQDCVARLKAEEYQQAVLLGMGGSSLAPEVYAALFGERGLPLTVLDSTAPDHVAGVTAACAGRRTLFIVSSKSGSTAETSALEAHCFAWMAARDAAPGRHFIAITDPGSALEVLARERGYRAVFANPADIGGRFSALSFFGLLPAAIAGADLAALRRYLPDTPDSGRLAADAVRLGQVLGELAQAGRNKLNLCFSAALAPLGAWVEQLIDESTGKLGRGIVVIADEPRFDAGHYGDDRVFAAVGLEGDIGDAHWFRELADRGHPLLRWRLPHLDALGAEFYRWEIATAVAGQRLGINPFDEPDVDASKAATRALLEQPHKAPPAAAQSPAALAAMLEQARPGDYLAILAYLEPGAAQRAGLAALREHLARRSGLPTCVGFGPRYLHSSGQLHKGGPDQGLFLMLTRGAQRPLPIPGAQHDFASLFAAQAQGDLRVLRERGRRVVHLQLDDGQTPEGLIDRLP